MKTMHMPTVMGPQHQFSLVPKATIERSVFDRSHGHKTTFNAGGLVPVLVDEVLPGDTFHLSMAALVRLTTPIKPVMDNMYLDSFFFFVPYRLVWANFVKFMGEQVNPGDSTSFTIPQMVSPAGGYVIGSVGDFFGLPTVGQVTGGLSVSHSALPIRAYALIYNQWFRDENLINSNAFALTGDGPDANTLAAGTLLSRGKRHDYFTSCLPFLQKGTAVAIPLGTTAPVIPSSAHAPPSFWNITSASSAGVFQRAAAGANTGVNVPNAGAAGEQLGWATTALVADLTNASAASINALRQSFQIQKLLERDARGGTRYTEKIKAHFGVTSPDARLQRAEYLGGGSTPISISPLAQTGQTGLTGGATPLGNLAGVGTAMATRGHGFVKSFTEHGVLIGLVNVRADLTYQQGLERQWSRSTIYDLYWPALAHIGEQAVLNQEIYVKGDANDPLVFGYQERYAEYRYKPSRISGQMRSTAATTFEIWHLSEKFAALPTLAQTFIEDHTHTILSQRINAVTTEPDFYGDFYFTLKCARPMPVYGVPGLIDHF